MINLRGGFAAVLLVGAGMLLRQASPPVAENKPSPATSPASSPAASRAGPYDIGRPVLAEIWVDGKKGDDSNTGLTRPQALRTLRQAWNRIPAGAELTGGGYRIRIAAGELSAEQVPNYWESRYGTRECPILLEAADGPGTVTLPGMNVFDCRYLYLIGLRLVADGGDVLHFERVDHGLLRRVTVEGRGDIHKYAGPQEAFKANQSQHIYVEDCDISGGHDNAVDFVAVQYGHILDSRIHRAHDWCVYLKGGSAYFRVEGNEIYDGGTGGFSAGQGTGLEFMVAPWLNYEAYDIRFVNNRVHDTRGAGVGVQGGYNILIAHNTMVRVGATSHAIEVVFGLRGCDGDAAACRKHLAAGGWGTARADNNLQIRGNLLWNGPGDLSLGIEDSTLDEKRLRAENAINTLEPKLVDPASGGFRPARGGNVAAAKTYTIPDFTWTDPPPPLPAPKGELSNAASRAPSGAARPPGVFAGE